MLPGVTLSVEVDAVSVISDEMCYCHRVDYDSVLTLLGSVKKQNSTIRVCDLSKILNKHRAKQP